MLATNVVLYAGYIWPFLQGVLSDEPSKSKNLMTENGARANVSYDSWVRLT
jgi:hypothetical protein